MNSITAPNLPKPISSTRSGNHLYGPLTDFLLLGGGSLLPLLFIWLFLGGDASNRGWSLAAAFTLANVVNHPHFAHSYQIFYSGFLEKLTGARYVPSLRIRYALVGIIAPIAIAIALCVPIYLGQPRMLGLAANAMFFLVGWHYVKQGYGMAMLDAALKKSFYSDREKAALLRNAYAVWILSWLLANKLIGQSPEYWEVQYVAVPVADGVLLGIGAMCAITTGQVVLQLARARRSRNLAWNGLVAYATSLYVWLLVRDPIVLIWVPLFHSLQYLAVVWRFQHRRIVSDRSTRTSTSLRMLVFLVAGLGLGYYAFLVLPGWLSANVDYDRTLFGAGLFYFVVWIFINVHHYLLDTVMWRRGNPDVAEYLFGVRTGVK